MVPVGPCRPRAALTIPLRSAAPSPQQRPRVPMATRRAGAGPARRGRSRQRGADSMVAGRCSAPAVSTELRRCPLHARRRPCPPVPLPGRSRLPGLANAPPSDDKTQPPSVGKRSGRVCAEGGQSAMQIAAGTEGRAAARPPLFPSRFNESSLRLRSRTERRLTFRRERKREKGKGERKERERLGKWDRAEPQIGSASGLGGF